MVTVEILKDHSGDIGVVPAPRSNVASCFVRDAGQGFIFGGSDSERFFSDLWRYDTNGEKWTYLGASQADKKQKNKSKEVKKSEEEE